MSHFALVILVLALIMPTNGQDSPEYTAYWDRLLKLGKKQENDYLYSAFLMPEASNNPSITPWLNNDDNKHPSYLISWCNSFYACFYYVVAIGYENHSFQFNVVKSMDNFEYFDNHEGAGRKPLFEFRGDIRLYQVDNSTTKMTFNKFRGKYQDTYIAQVYYHKGLDALYILNNPQKVNIVSEYGTITQKNWIPFIHHNTVHLNHTNEGSRSHNSQDYKPTEQTKKEEQSEDGWRKLVDTETHTTKHLKEFREELFVYSVYPHKIVHSNESDAENVYYHTICTTQVKLSSGNKFWNYGEPRGGTPAVLIDTIHGPRYLTIFHSQGNFAVPYILTYYFGAYIFEASPPFAITHMTVDPIIPTEMYSEKHGWAFKAIDYIVFPTGLVVRDGMAYVTVGRNDKSGWMLAMNVSGLINSLTAVSSEVISNRFHSYFMNIYGHVSHKDLN